MARYKVACVSMDYDAEHDDCRSIEEIGFNSKGGAITTRTPAEVYDMIVEDGHTIVLTYKGDRWQLQPVERGGRRYVRAAETDTSDDTLLKKPSC
jgi:hypothetical protein